MREYENELYRDCKGQLTVSFLLYIMHQNPFQIIETDFLHEVYRSP